MGIFLIGVTFNNKNFITYTHLVEYMGSRATFVTGLLFCVDSCIFIFCPLTMMYLTKNTEKYLGLIFAVTVGVLIHTNLFPESLQFLIANKQYDAAMKNVDLICKKNNCTS